MKDKFLNVNNILDWRDVEGQNLRIFRISVNVDNIWTTYEQYLEYPCLNMKKGLLVGGRAVIFNEDQSVLRE